MFASTYDGTTAGSTDGFYDNEYTTTGVSIRIREFEIPEELFCVQPPNWRWFHSFYEPNYHKFVARHFRARQRAFRFLIMPSVLDNVRWKRRKRLQRVRL